MIQYDSKNWLDICLRVRGSVLPHLLPRIVLAAAVGALAAWLFQTRGFRIPPIAHTLIGVALGLLLVFRTNSAYDRYWEGRKLLASIVNLSRNIVRQVSTLLEGDAARIDETAVDVRRLVLLLYATIRQSLRSETDLAQLGVELTSGEHEALTATKARPCTVAAWISLRLARACREGLLSDQRLRLVDPLLTGMMDAWGGAERIKNTPIPFAYAQHIKTFVLLFGFTVPLAMVEALRWYTPIAAGVLAFALFGIDEIGVEIEEPFGYDANDLPLGEIGEQIASSTAEVVAGAKARRSG